MISSGEVGIAIRKIKRLIKKDESYEALLTASVRRILAAKYDAGVKIGEIANSVGTHRTLPQKFVYL